MDFTPIWKEPNCDLLVQAILSLQNEEDVYRLLDDLCTITEIKAMSQRINVAKLLFVKTTYNEVARETGASTATISRVKRCLNYGADGYQRVLRACQGMNVSSDLEKPKNMQKESGHEK